MQVSQCKRTKWYKLQYDSWCALLVVVRRYRGFHKAYIGAEKFSIILVARYVKDRKFISVVMR